MFDNYRPQNFVKIYQIHTRFFVYLFLCVNFKSVLQHCVLTIIDPLKPSETCSLHQNPPFPSEIQRGKSGEKLRKKFSGQLDHQADTSNPLGGNTSAWCARVLKGTNAPIFNNWTRVQLLKLGKLTYSMAKLKGLSAHNKSQIV